MNRPHVAIAVPTYGMWQGETVTSLLSTFSNFMRFVGSGQAGMSVHTHIGTLIPAVRNSLVKEILEDNRATHILWIDADMVFPKDVIERFLMHDVPMVCANYSSRKKPPVPVTWAADKRVYTKEESTGLEKVSFSGLGCALIRTEIYRNLSKPWHMLFDVGEGDILGEDVYFFRKVKQELNIDLWCDHDVSKEIGHVGIHNYMMADVVDAPPANRHVNFDDIDVIGGKK